MCATPTREGIRIDQSVVEIAQSCFHFVSTKKVKLQIGAHRILYIVGIDRAKRPS